MSVKVKMVGKSSYSLTRHDNGHAAVGRGMGPVKQRWRSNYKVK